MRFFCLFCLLMLPVTATASINNEDFMQQHKIPRLEFAVLNAGSITRIERFNLHDQQLSRPLFNVASLAKPVFASLVLQLVDKGLWTLDAPIAEVWTDPSLQGHPWADTLTSRHILSHQSGFPNWRSGQELEFEFEPGTKMNYSGEGFEYLQRALEHQFDMSLEALFQQHLAASAALSDMHFSVPNAQYEEKIARWFDTNGEAYTMHDHTSASAADNLTASIDSYASFIGFMMQGAKLAPTLYRSMLTPQGKPSDRFQMALGWEILEGISPDGPIYLHSGSDKGANSIAIFSPATGEALIIFTNSDNGNKAFAPLIKQHLSFGNAMINPQNSS